MRFAKTQFCKTIVLCITWVATICLAPSAPHAEANNLKQIIGGLTKKENAKEERGETLVLQLQIKNAPPSHWFVHSISRSGQIFLPLRDLVQMLQFPITFDYDNRKAYGYFIKSENSFDLDVTQQKIRLHGQGQDIPPHKLVYDEGQTYVSSEVFTTWFGIKTEIDPAAGILHLTTDAPLPLDKDQDLPDAPAIPNSTAWVDPDSYSATGGDLAEKKSVSIPVTIGQNGTHNGTAEPIKLLTADTTKNQTPPFDKNPPEPLALPTPTAWVDPENYEPNSTANRKSQSNPAPIPARKPIPIPVSFNQPNKNNTASSSGKQGYSILSDDGLKLTAVRDNLTLGFVDAHIDRQSTYLRFNSIVGLLGSAYLRQGIADTAQILLKDGSIIYLDFQKREYIQKGVHHSFYSNDIYRKEDEYYANTELLNRLFPKISFVVDLSAHQVDLSIVSSGILSLFGGGSSANLADLAPAPQASPAQPVIIDDVNTQQSQISPETGQSTPVTEAQDVMHIDSGATPAPLPSAPASPAETPVAVAQKENKTPEDEKESNTNGEEETLILLPKIKDLPSKNEFIEALAIDERVFLPLRDIIQMFDFPIKFTGNTIVSGFFLAPQNTIYLDTSKNEARIAEKAESITSNDIKMHNDQIYINTETFARWFGIEVQLDRSNSIIHFTTDKLLPQEEKEERQKRWRALTNNVEKENKDYPLVQNPYQGLGYPAIDVNIGTLYSHNASSTPLSVSSTSSSITSTQQTPSTSSSATSTKPFTSNYNVQAAGDVAYMTGQFYLQGDLDGTAPKDMRLQLGRKDINADLLGAMHATEFEMGDVTAPSLTLMTAPTLGRGATITNADINTSTNFDFRNFTGDSTPGYEVELYRNDVLLAFQTVDSSGRYSFTNIPILYGDNIFRIVFYGQQGQREEKVETISAASSLLKAGKFVYTLGADQRGDSLIPINPNSSSSVYTPPGMELVGNLRYGLTSDITVGASVAETKLIDGEHQYIGASTGINLNGILAEGNFAEDMTSKGWAASLAALGGWEGINFHTRYRKFNNFSSEAINDLSQPLTSDASFDVNTQLYLPLLGSYSVGLSALRETFVDPVQVPRNTYSWRSSKSLWGLSFTNSLDYVVDQEKKLQSTYGVQTRIANVDLRAVGIMEMKPIQQLSQASLMADYRLTEKLSAQSEYNKNLANNKTSYGQNFNWDFDKFRLSFAGQIQNSGEYTAGLNLIFSLNHDSVSNSWHSQPLQTSDSGAISGRIFTDEKNNRTFEDGDKILPNANVRVDGNLVKSDAENYFRAPVTPYQVLDLTLDPTSITDPLLSPEIKGYKLLTRPGDTVVADFPLAHTTIIDGTVVLYDEKGKRRDLSDIVIELEDHDGKPVRRVISEIDGYFSFDKITIGDYWLTVPAEALQTYHAVVEKKVRINIKEINDFMTGNEIVLRQVGKLDFSSLRSMLSFIGLRDNQNYLLCEPNVAAFEQQISLPEQSTNASSAEPQLCESTENTTTRP